MIDEERIKEAERNVRQYLSEGLLKIKDNEHILLDSEKT